MLGPVLGALRCKQSLARTLRPHLIALLFVLDVGILAIGHLTERLTHHDFVALIVGVAATATGPNARILGACCCAGRWRPALGGSPADAKTLPRLLHALTREIKRRHAPLAPRHLVVALRPAERILVRHDLGVLHLHHRLHRARGAIALLPGAARSDLLLDRNRDLFRIELARPPLDTVFVLLGERPGLELELGVERFLLAVDLVELVVKLVFLRLLRAALRGNRALIQAHHLAKARFSLLTRPLGRSGPLAHLAVAVALFLLADATLTLADGLIGLLVIVTLAHVDDGRVFVGVELFVGFLRTLGHALFGTG